MNTQTHKLRKAKFVVKKSSYLAIGGLVAILFGVAMAALLAVLIAQNNPTASWGYFVFPGGLILLGYGLTRAGIIKENVLLVDNENITLIQKDKRRTQYKASDISASSTAVDKYNAIRIVVSFNDGNKFVADNSYTHKIALIRYLEYWKKQSLL